MKKTIDHNVQLGHMKARLEAWYDKMLDHAGLVEDGGPGGEITFRVEGYLDLDDAGKSICVTVSEKTDERF